MLKLMKTFAKTNVHPTGDPTEAVDTGRDLYNRLQLEEDDTEAYPDVPLHIGSRRPHADASGVDTFYGMDRALPPESMGKEDTEPSPYSDIDAVVAGLRERENNSNSHLTVNTNRSGAWDAQTYYIDSTLAVVITNDREFRGDTVITNWSTMDIYISPVALTSGGIGAAVKVAANGGSRTIRTQKQIWALGTNPIVNSQQIDVAQEYD